jgi:F0F1-type ATP synthase epsilon subunit
MKLRMISSDSLREMDVEWLDITTAYGQQTIGAGHAPYVVPLKPQSSLQLHLPGGAVTSVPVLGGIVHADRTSINVIIVDTL